MTTDEAIEYINAAETEQERSIRKLRMYTTLYGTSKPVADSIITTKETAKTYYRKY